MTDKEEEFLKKLQAMFRVEAAEHLQVLSMGIIELEKNPESKTSPELLETIFREAHSLKGAARSVNRSDIESICQVLESIFAKLKNKEIFFITVQFDQIHKSIELISKILPDETVRATKEHAALIKQLRSIAEPEQKRAITEKQTAAQIIPSEKFAEVEQAVIKKVPEKAKVPEEKQANKIVKDEPAAEVLMQMETVRIPLNKLDPLFLQAEQMTQSKIAFAQRYADLKAIDEFIDLWKTDLKKLNASDEFNSNLPLKEIYQTTNEKLKELERNLNTIIHAIESDQRSLGRMIDEHVESMKQVLMLPVSVIIDGFPKLVRDLSRSQGKEVDLVIRGKEIEVDKRILDELKDPLIHLVRNSVDHGIKNKAETGKNKKSHQGTITLSFSVIDGRNLEIIISDDGEGINTAKVISAAVKCSAVSAESAEKLDHSDALALIFKSGVSTSPMITSISGRGLGLAIVIEKVEKLGGTISVESKQNEGATFRLILPLTLSTHRGVLVRTGEHLFFMPTLNVERAVRININDVKTVENKDTILIDDQVIGIKKLSEIMHLKISNAAGFLKKSNQDSASRFLQVIILAKGDTRIGFVVDEVFDEHQVLVKELGRQLKRIKNISSATVLGSGKVVPVLNVTDLMNAAMGMEPTSRIIEKTDDLKINKILVVDDSITSRSLIKNILETVGYEITTAVDGVDAYTKALIGEFDLVVSDVDMPRMNGFELTTKIRNEKKLSELPVVLVTALESREDMEHGIDVGANAYIVKSSFDQSNLLDVVKKLL